MDVGREMSNDIPLEICQIHVARRMEGGSYWRIVLANVVMSRAIFGGEYAITSLDCASKTLAALPDDLSKVGIVRTLWVVVLCKLDQPGRSCTIGRSLTRFISPALDCLRDGVVPSAGGQVLAILAVRMLELAVADILLCICRQGVAPDEGFGSMALPKVVVHFEVRLPWSQGWPLCPQMSAPEYLLKM